MGKATPVAYLCVIGLLSTTHSWRHDTDHQRLVVSAVALVLVLLASGLIRLVGRRAPGGGKTRKPRREGGYAIVPAKGRGR